MHMENQVRIFRKNPIAWWDKNAMRYLRRKYGQVKKTFALIRAVYLALCEIESDFSDTPINFSGYNGFCGSCSTPFIEPQTSKFSSQLSA